LYFTYLSDQRQREHLVISGANISIHPSDKSFTLTKEFKVTNISGNIISIREINFDIEAKGKENRNFEIKADGISIGYNGELNKIIKSGETLTLKPTRNLPVNASVRNTKGVEQPTPAAME
jgi:hypothetical protein